MRGLLKFILCSFLCLNPGLPIQGLVRLSGVVSFAPSRLSVGVTGIQVMVLGGEGTNSEYYAAKGNEAHNRNGPRRRRTASVFGAYRRAKVRDV
jgi:hypothetical protein